LDGGFQPLQAHSQVTLLNWFAHSLKITLEAMAIRLHSSKAKGRGAGAATGITLKWRHVASGWG